MDWSIVVTFLMATGVLLLTPGPVMAVLVGNTIAGGRAAGIKTVFGIALGETLLSGAIVGLSFSSGDLLRPALPWISLLGASYLLWMAVQALWPQPTLAPEQNAARRPFAIGLAITLSNPTAVLFYAAFFASFLDGSGSLTRQIWMLASIYVAASLVFDTACVLLVARFHIDLIENAAFGRMLRVGSAVVYLGTGLAAIGTVLTAVPA